MELYSDGEGILLTVNKKRSLSDWSVDVSAPFYDGCITFNLQLYRSCQMYTIRSIENKGEYTPESFALALALLMKHAHRIWSL